MSEPLLNILIAYPYFSKRYIEYLKSKDHGTYNLIVDSGAFTAWNTGRTILLDDYCRFLDSIECLRPFHYVQLDVFGQPEASYKNLLTMRARGFTDVMPVFTRGETLERLDEYYTMTDYIMFGGIVTGGQNKEYVKWFLNNNKGRKCHWLGFVNLDFIKHYKPVSTDSSSWMNAGRFGSISFYDGFGDLTTIKKNEFMRRPSEKILEAAERVGLSYTDLTPLGFKEAWINSGQGVDLKRDKKCYAIFITSLSYVLRGIEVQRALGTKIYLAMGGGRHLEIVYAALEHLIKKGKVST